MDALLNLIVWLLVAGIVIYIVNLLIGMLTLPAQIKTIILIVISLVFLILILRQLGLFVF